MGETGDWMGPTGPEGETGDEALAEETKKRIDDVCAQIEVKIGELKKILDSQNTDLQKMDPGWADALRAGGHSVSSEDRTFLNNFEKNYNTFRTKNENTQDVGSLGSILEELNEKLSKITSRVKSFEGFRSLPERLSDAPNLEEEDREMWQVACGHRDTLNEKRAAMIDQVQAMTRRLTEEESEMFGSLNAQTDELLPYTDDHIQKMKPRDIRQYIQIVKELNKLIIIFTHALRNN